jgi:hypothetical protein
MNQDPAWLACFELFPAGQAKTSIDINQMMIQFAAHQEWGEMRWLDQLAILLTYLGVQIERAHSQLLYILVNC